MLNNMGWIVGGLVVFVFVVFFIGFVIMGLDDDGSDYILVMEI